MQAKPGTGARRAEMLAALSLAIDLGLGQPMEHMLRSCVLALRLADELGLDEPRRSNVYYGNLLAWIGCHADSHEISALFDDDVRFRAASYTVDKKGLPLAALLLRQIGAGLPPLRRGLKVAAFLRNGKPVMHDLIRSHCVSASALASRVGLGERMSAVLAHVFERWDGAGLPEGARGEAIPLETRIVHLADTAEVFLRTGGVEAAVRMVRQRRGTQFDPALCDLFCERAEKLAADLTDIDAWTVAMELAPDDAQLSPEGLDVILLAMADFVDLKSPYTVGHSRAVARLASGAGKLCGLPADDVRDLRLAGLVHDLGRMGVPNGIWDKKAPLSAAEQERVRLHPYLTGRILHRVPALRRISDLAGTHHERLDGSGYSRGLSGAQLSRPARILAAADAYQTALEPRPHRPASPAEQASARLRQEVTGGRLDAEAVEAVLASAGHQVRRRRTWPAGLTTREVEVLRLITRAKSNRDIAAELHIAEKTVRNHVEHIYAKIGASNRTGASLFAMHHGLISQA